MEMPWRQARGSYQAPSHSTLDSVTELLITNQSLHCCLDCGSVEAKKLEIRPEHARSRIFESAHSADCLSTLAQLGGKISNHTDHWLTEEPFFHAGNTGKAVVLSGTLTGIALCFACQTAPKQRSVPPDRLLNQSQPSLPCLRTSLLFHCAAVHGRKVVSTP